ncbi:hypothetical protein DFH27DRAFT_612271 [Peziza echinospora]|nr:hypothetical protein DFH27DRAFT_612271 [Peziza echinospora]
MQFKAIVVLALASFAAASPTLQVRTTPESCAATGGIVACCNGFSAIPILGGLLCTVVGPLLSCNAGSQVSCCDNAQTIGNGNVVALNLGLPLVCNLL